MKTIAVFAVHRIKDNLYAASSRPVDKNGPYLVGCPGGKIEEGESELDALYRECEEEGWKIDGISKVPIYKDYINGDAVHWYYVEKVEMLKEYKEKGRVDPVIMTDMHLALSLGFNPWIYDLFTQNFESIINKDPEFTYRWKFKDNDMLSKKWPNIFRSYPNSKYAFNKFSFKCENGWYDLLDRTASFINEELIKNPELKFYTDQVKQKFGGLRFYYTLEGAADGYDTISKIISEAEQKSFEICEMTGNPGVCIPVYRSWVKTVSKEAYEKNYPISAKERPYDELVKNVKEGNHENY